MTSFRTSKNSSVGGKKQRRPAVLKSNTPADPRAKDPSVGHRLKSTIQSDLSADGPSPTRGQPRQRVPKQKVGWRPGQTTQRIPGKPTRSQSRAAANAADFEVDEPPLVPYFGPVGENIHWNFLPASIPLPAAPPEKPYRELALDCD